MLDCRWLKTWALHFCYLFWAWRFLWNTCIILRNTDSCYTSRFFVVLVILGLWTLYLRPHLSRYKNSSCLISCGQTCNTVNCTALVNMKQNFWVFYFFWDCGHLISGHIKVDAKTVLATRTVVTWQDVDKLVNTLKHCIWGWILHWTYRTTCRH